MTNLDKHWLMWDDIIKKANEKDLKIYRSNYIILLKKEVLGILEETITNNCFLCDEFFNKKDYNCYKCPLYLLQGDSCSGFETPFSKIQCVRTIKSFIKYATIIRDCVKNPKEKV